MSIITGIEANRGLVSVYADGALAVRVRRAHFDKCPLREGDEADLEAWLDRLAAVQFQDAWEAALSSLDVRDRTEKDIREGLGRRGYVSRAVEAVCERLRLSGLIDDARYAERMAELQAKKPVGRYAFKRKLRAKGISDQDAEEALARFDDAQQQSACLEAAQRLFKKYGALPPREGRAKLSQALARRGFGWDAVESAVDELYSD